MPSGLLTHLHAWPAQKWKGSFKASITRTDGKSRMDLLNYRAEQGFTRPGPAIMPDGRAISRRILKGRARRRLNPLYVGWLMGWPPGHALCDCSATEFTLWQQHMRGALSRLPMASAR